MPLHFVLIDGNSLGMTAAARAYMSRHDPTHRARPLWQTRSGFPNGAVHGTMASLLYALPEVEAAYPEHTVFPVILWDGRAQWRYDQHPGYKPRSTDADYVAMKAKYRQEMPGLRGLMYHIGLPQIIGVEEEADDIAGHLAPQLAHFGPVPAVSKDGDWTQVVAPNVRCYVHGEHARFIGEADLATLGGEKYGFASTASFVQAKALAGDTSDGIIGVDNVGVQRAADLIKEFGSPEAFWAQVDNGTHVPKGVIRARLATAETRMRYAFNMKLIDWRQSPPLQSSTFLWSGPPQPEEAQAILAELELKQIGTRLAAHAFSLDFHQALSDSVHPLHQAMNCAWGYCTTAAAT